MSHELKIWFSDETIRGGGFDSRFWGEYAIQGSLFQLSVAVLYLKLSYTLLRRYPLHLSSHHTQLFLLYNHQRILTWVSLFIQNINLILTRHWIVIRGPVPHISRFSTRHNSFNLFILVTISVVQVPRRLVIGLQYNWTWLVSLIDFRGQRFLSFWH